MATMHERIAQYGVRMVATEVTQRPAQDSWDGHEEARHYRVTLTRHGKRMTVYYSMGPAHTEGPKVADVLDCLVSDAAAGEQTFEEFCAELGYDEDSCRAERTWKACKRVAEKLRRLFTDDELNVLTYETERM